MKRPCDACGGSYEAKRATSRYCSSNCRTKASRAAKAGKPIAHVVKMPAPGSGRAGELERATVDELDKVGRLDTARGKAAVLLARRCDTATAESGTSTAALFRQWGEALQKATAGTGTEKSALDRAKDELAARRAKRGA